MTRLKIDPDLILWLGPLALFVGCVVWVVAG